jgi:hypothetical protein
MRQKSMEEKTLATLVVKNIRRVTRRHFAAEDKICIVLQGLPDAGQSHPAGGSPGTLLSPALYRAGPSGQPRWIEMSNAQRDRRVHP